MATFLDKLKPQYGREKPEPDPNAPQKKRTSPRAFFDKLKPQYGREQPEPEPAATAPPKKRLSFGDFLEKLKPQASRESGETKESGATKASATAQGQGQGQGQEPASNTQPRVEPEPGQDFTIQPHPAKTNDPADEQRQQTGGGLNTANGPAQAFHTPGPQIPTREQSEALPPPASHEELQARAAELNRDQ